MTEQVDFARNHGYVQTVLGRRRYLKDINSANAIVRGGAERNAVNAPIQGSAADIIKIALLNINTQLTQNNLKSRALLQVHDELIFEVMPDEAKVLEEIVRTQMAAAFKLRVKLDVNIGFGESWDLAAH